MVSMTTVRYLSARAYDLDAQVVIEQANHEAQAGLVAQSKTGQIEMDGEVHRTAERLRETEALTLAASLCAISERARGHVMPTVAALSKQLLAEHLLPPEVRIDEQANGVFFSRCAIIYLRYRVAPLGIEAVSVGRERLDGPSLIVQLAGDGGEAVGPVVFMARRLGQVSVPDPFAPALTVISLGWERESLRESALSAAEQQQLRAWMHAK